MGTDVTYRVPASNPRISAGSAAAPTCSDTLSLGLSATRQCLSIARQPIRASTQAKPFARERKYHYMRSGKALPRGAIAHRETVVGPFLIQFRPGGSTIRQRTHCPLTGEAVSRTAIDKASAFKPR